MAGLRTPCTRCTLILGHSRMRLHAPRLHLPDLPNNSRYQARPIFAVTLRRWVTRNTIAPRCPVFNEPRSRDNFHDLRVRIYIQDRPFMRIA